MSYRFGRFELVPSLRELRADGEPVHVEQQVFEVLVHLAKNCERVVTKEELLDEVWGDRFVSESTLTSRIKSARRAVDDDGQRQAVIRTVHGVGFRLLIPVEPQRPLNHESPRPTTAASTPAPVPADSDQDPTQVHSIRTFVLYRSRVDGRLPSARQATDRAW